MDSIDLHYIVVRKDDLLVERFGVDPDPAPIATAALDARDVRTPAAFDVEAIVSGSALVGMLFFVVLVAVGSLDTALAV